MKHVSIPKSEYSRRVEKASKLIAEQGYDVLIAKGFGASTFIHSCHTTKRFGVFTDSKPELINIGC